MEHLAFKVQIRILLLFSLLKCEGWERERMKIFFVNKIMDKYQGEKTVSRNL